MTKQFVILYNIRSLLLSPPTPFVKYVMYRVSTSGTISNMDQFRNIICLPLNRPIDF